MKDLKTIAVAFALVVLFMLAKDPSRLERWVKYGPMALAGQIHLND